MRFFKPCTREEIIADDPLREFFIWWDDISEDDLESLEKVLQSALREQDLQAFLQSNPILLIQHLGGGHGRWVIPMQRLGAEHVTDFVIGHMHSFGYEWQAVELESPKSRMFTKAGDPSKELSHAIRQIQDWRAWLQRNQNYAARPKSKGGLGLTDIVSSIPGLILIGRRSDIDPATNERRRQMVNDLNIQIHSYDYLLSCTRGRIEALTRQRDLSGSTSS
jgi:hypothetical protein